MEDDLVSGISIPNIPSTMNPKSFIRIPHHYFANVQGMVPTHAEPNMKDLKSTTVNEWPWNSSELSKQNYTPYLDTINNDILCRSKIQ